MRRGRPDKIFRVHIVDDAPVINAMFGAKIERPALNSVIQMITTGP
jgi:hypothetical protein